MQGKIVKTISNDYTVEANNKLYVCKGKGKFRLDKIKPVVGDNVIFDENKHIISDIMPRKNELVRPSISNVDQAFIITSVFPSFDSNLLDKLLDLIEFNNIKPIICFTKLDLVDSDTKKEVKQYMEYYKKIGYTIYENVQTSDIEKEFKDKISVFTGQTGAGKSTLLNKFDKNLNIKTNEISLALGRGKNTTTHVELLKLNDGLVADTPGFSDVYLGDMSNEDIRDNFIEFNEYKQDCQYRNCMHNKEEDCEIKRRVNDGTILKSRYENYLKFIK